jgi:hypothetical protein
MEEPLTFSFKERLDQSLIQKKKKKKKKKKLENPTKTPLQ